MSQLDLVSRPARPYARQVPILLDTQTNSIVNNESEDIMRMLNSEFNEFATNPNLDLYPAPLRPDILAVNAWVYPDINNCVYQ